VQLWVASAAAVLIAQQCATVQASAVSFMPSDRNSMTVRGGSQQRTSILPTLFSTNDPDGLVYDTYAACLAATEGLRRIRNNSSSNDAEAARRQYVRDSKVVLEALGMTVETFNAIGSQLVSDPALKEKVSSCLLNVPSNAVECAL